MIVIIWARALGQYKYEEEEVTNKKIGAHWCVWLYVDIILVSFISFFFEYLLVVNYKINDIYLNLALRYYCEVSVVHQTKPTNICVIAKEIYNGQLGRIASTPTWHIQLMEIWIKCCRLVKLNSPKLSPIQLFWANIIFIVVYLFPASQPHDSGLGTLASTPNSFPFSFIIFFKATPFDILNLDWVFFFPFFNFYSQLFHPWPSKRIPTSFFTLINIPKAQRSVQD